MAHNQNAYYSDPAIVMDPRNLGAMQPTRLSASRSFMSKMIRENWRIEREVFEIDRRGNGQARYSISTPEGALTFLAFMSEPSNKNRTGRIIGTSWDMIGALIDGVATAEQVRETEEELPRLYEGRATANTLMWFRSNQSLRIFRAVRAALARGDQPDIKDLRHVGYIMRNTGLDGNGTFGTTPFAAIRKDHPLKSSYHAQMLSAYLMRELSVDLVEELARLDAPDTAVCIDPSIKRLIGVGNGSALGLAMLFYNRPILVNSYISAYLKVVDHVLRSETLGTKEDFTTLEDHLNRTIRYRSFLTTSYRFFTSNMEIVADLRRIRAKVRAAARGEVIPAAGDTVLATIHREASAQVSKEALHSFNTLLMELVPDYCAQISEQYLNFEENLALDPTTPLNTLREVITTSFQWALSLPLNDDENRDRVWYQSRAAEEPRSGPREEVPEAHELIQSYPLYVRELLSAIDHAEHGTTLGDLLSNHPELEYITRLVLSLKDKPYATAYADPHDTDFVPVWVIRFVNSFIHGLDRTEDHMGRDVRGLIFESAPYRDEIAEADDSTWWWSYEKPAVSTRTAHIAPAAGAAKMGATSTGEMPAAKVVLTPIQTPITPPEAHDTETIEMKYRELRLMAGRAYQALNVPQGSWHGGREFVVTSLVADLQAATAFGDLLISAIDPDTGKAPAWRAPSYSNADGMLVIDNHGQSLLATGHVLVNLLGSHAGDTPQRFEIVNAVADHALAGLQLELSRYGISLDLAEADGTGTDANGTAPDRTVTPPTHTGTVAISSDPETLKKEHRQAMYDFVVNGRTVDSRTFWNIYYRANAGLDVDTPISRQHTGGTVLDVIKPGERITKQFTSEELHLLTDPDELDNQNITDFIAAH
ncbi:hypothetical protein LWF01_05555 [Saxibacter everestensis]|uniref:Uncharacterized protein n=1 Tax=Saxibacter everestensis TaxID=2909229 RepID=A0ABY8QWB8_9MICO|nr:hypothetical protein LWF01_05555 [Brevibacteriaceae bacterium ZFBP1038]